MSELGDKERRFVEDQRRITVRTNNEMYSMPNVAGYEALLAEAAEVLRDYALYDVTAKSRWWQDKAQPLLDKLEERE